MPIDSLSKRLMASILFASHSLMSCSGLLNADEQRFRKQSVAPSQEGLYTSPDQITSQEDELTLATSYHLEGPAPLAILRTPPSSAQEFIAKELAGKTLQGQVGQEVTFYQEAGVLKGKTWTHSGLDVYIGKVNLAQGIKPRHIHIVSAKQAKNKKGYVYIDQGGLLGGMMENEGDDLSNLPNECFCPINHEVMEEPVLAQDGHTYEKAAILQWFSMGKRTSPKTGAKLPGTVLLPNYSMRSLIASLKASIPALARYKVEVANLKGSIKLLGEKFQQELGLKDKLLQQEKNKVSQLEKQVADISQKPSLPTLTNKLPHAATSMTGTRSEQPNINNQSNISIKVDSKDLKGAVTNSKKTEGEVKNWSKKKIDQLAIRASKKDSRAFKQLIKVAQQQHIYAEFKLGKLYQEGKGLKRDEQQAFEWFQKAANQGHAASQFNLGLMYQNGEGVDRDEEQAVLWYQKAANQGYAPAQCNLGSNYQNGDGVTKDSQTALFWYQKAANQGHAVTQNNLGVMYQYGEGVTKDDKKAVEWYQKAAEQGHADAQNNLGNMYYNGEGVTKNYQTALFWYQKAANQGYAFAQCNLGHMHYYGYSRLQKPYEEAVLWYQKAANQGHASAQNKLGDMYHHGYGVAKDDQQAFEWYQKAANQGYPKAQYHLGLMYYWGSGVKRDREKGIMWCQKAASQEDLDAKKALEIILASDSSAEED